MRRPSDAGGIALVDREEELSRLDRALNSTLPGRLKVFFLSGELGIGKTALLNTFVRGARSTILGLRVAGFGCYAIAGAQHEPYLPFQRILDSLSKERGDRSWEQLRRALSELAPDWISALPMGGVIAALLRTVQWGKREFLSKGDRVDVTRRAMQYAAAVRAIAERAPLLFWIDDLQWSDRATLDLISFLADEVSDVRLLLLLAYRSTDISLETESAHQHPLRLLLNKLRRYGQCEELELTPLERDGVKRFLHTFGYHVPETMLDRLSEQSGGNPLFLREFLVVLEKQREIQALNGEHFFNSGALHVDIPQTLRNTVLQRLDSAGDRMVRLLEVASIEGEVFHATMAAQLLEASESHVMESLDSLIRDHQLVKEVQENSGPGFGGEEYRFVHGAVQQVVYSRIGQSRRRNLHRRLAHLLEGLFDVGSSLPAGMLARHFELGGEFEQAGRYYLLSSRSALDILALDDAITQLRCVMRFFGGAPTEEIATTMDRASARDEGTARISLLIEALTQLVEAHCLKADYGKALDYCRRGETLSVRDQHPEQYAGLLYWWANTLSMMEREAEALPLAREALEILGDSPTNRRLEGYLHAFLASVHQLLPLVEAEAAIEKALAIASDYDLPDVQVRALIHRAWISVDRTYELARVSECCRAALGVAERHKLLAEQVVCHRLLAHGFRRQGRAEEALAHNRDALELAKSSGLLMSQHIALHSLAITRRTAFQDWGGSLELIRQAVDLAKKHRFAISRYVLDNWFTVTCSLGRWAEASQAQELSLEADPGRYPRSQGFYSLRQGHLAYARGRYEVAVGEFTRSIDTFKKHVPGERDARLVQPFLGIALAEIGQHGAAEQVLEAAFSFWSGRHPALAAVCLHGLARSDLSLGRYERASEHLQDAISLARDRFSRTIWPTEAYAPIDCARACLRLGEIKDALRYALVGYKKFQRWGHFLLGEAAFAVGQIFWIQGRAPKAGAFLVEARHEWSRLGLEHKLTEWVEWVQESGAASTMRRST